MHWFVLIDNTGLGYYSLIGNYKAQNAYRAAQAARLGYRLSRLHKHSALRLGAYASAEYTYLGNSGDSYVLVLPDNNANRHYMADNYTGRAYFFGV